MVFACLGWRDHQRDAAGLIAPGEWDRLRQFINSGGYVYIEGNDFFRDHMAALDSLQQYTGVEEAEDGCIGLNVDYLTFESILPFEGDTAVVYSDQSHPGPDTWVDRIVSLYEYNFELEDGESRTVAYSDSDTTEKRMVGAYYNGMRNRTFSSTVVLGALEDNRMNTKSELLSQIIELVFDISEPTQGCLEFIVDPSPGGGDTLSSGDVLEDTLIFRNHNEFPIHDIDCYTYFVRFTPEFSVTPSTIIYGVDIPETASVSIALRDHDVRVPSSEGWVCWAGPCWFVSSIAPLWEGYHAFCPSEFEIRHLRIIQDEPSILHLQNHPR
jgi:hypothetical protein